MKMTMLRIDPTDPDFLDIGRIDPVQVDATTDEQIALQQAVDDGEAMQEMAKFVRRVRSRLGLSQVEFSRLISVSVNTVNNWEHGKRYPVGTAKALLKILDRFPEQVLAVLS
ncbi:type II toxin-antitoxin system MqsA family antitoxin [Pseudanabaena sp. FACHB-1277]|jgi:putative transcriptional regulator|uniref:Type II toxin-antitoxin system MqsA family antitoxin n=1 Tax=Pseudanabaena cinerea FACHB-1277 TaxID=2949581 RepID=A0A926Z6M0_9CYAN|nr:type II toxin-antitoxin system MqsA family antitoxin [Pseudanabaena cinerea]MBD2148879.1 type II toxin-antitoxin system MqsA family antitoxin [Pseudanabaena cinerea FACHB-1277]